MKNKLHWGEWHGMGMQMIVVALVWTVIAAMILLKASLIGPFSGLGLFSLQDELIGWMITLLFIPIAVFVINKGVIQGYWLVSLGVCLSLALVISFVWTELTTEEVNIPLGLPVEGTNFTDGETTWVSNKSRFFQTDIFDLFSSFLLIIGISFAVSIFQLLRLRERSELKLKALLMQTQMDLLKAKFDDETLISEEKGSGTLVDQKQTDEVLTASSKIPIKLKNRTYFVQIEQIAYIKASGNYLEIYVEEKPHIIRETMTQFLERLPSHFLRIHKSNIVNTEFISELISIGYGDYELKMKDGKHLRISDSYKQSVLRALQV